ncbi:MAG TPA: tetratricopeptide repeat protein [Candidatus Acidoferrum sp.]|nr:tetratricopeptide repeat protein [Candidatus Acidoferrum sp.]
MATNPNTTFVAAPSSWPVRQVLMMSAIFLLIGLAIGYFLLGENLLPTPAAANAPALAIPPVHGASMGTHPVPTMDQMKQMAAVQTSSLIEKLKTDPNNAPLLIQVASIYKSSHQFKDAAAYYGRALKFDPKNVTARTEMASCLYYSGDVDGAISELQLSLKYDPKDPNSLFNLGLIKWQGKKDAAGAIAIWQELLKTNPNLDRRQIVEQMIADAKASEARPDVAKTGN